jgi:hypothetical protein
VVGIYLTIMIANMGGYVDKIMKGEIRDRSHSPLSAILQIKNGALSASAKLIKDRIAAEEERVGLNVPIAIRNFRYLSNALTLKLGRTINMTSDSGSKAGAPHHSGTFACHLAIDGYLAVIPFLFQHLSGAQSFAPLRQFLG